MISNRSRLAYNVNVKNYAVNMIEPASIIRIDFTLAVNLIKSQSGDPLTMPLPVLQNHFFTQTLDKKITTQLTTLIKQKVTHLNALKAERQMARLRQALPVQQQQNIPAENQANHSSRNNQPSEQPYNQPVERQPGQENTARENERIQGQNIAQNDIQRVLLGNASRQNERIQGQNAGQNNVQPAIQPPANNTIPNNPNPSNVIVNPFLRAAPNRQGATQPGSTDQPTNRDSVAPSRRNYDHVWNTNNNTASLPANDNPVNNLSTQPNLHTNNEFGQNQTNSNQQNTNNTQSNINNNRLNNNDSIFPIQNQQNNNQASNNNQQSTNIFGRNQTNSNTTNLFAPNNRNIVQPSNNVFGNNNNSNQGGNTFAQNNQNQTNLFGQNQNNQNTNNQTNFFGQNNQNSHQNMPMQMNMFNRNQNNNRQNNEFSSLVDPNQANAFLQTQTRNTSMFAQPANNNNKKSANVNRKKNLDRAC